MDSFQRARKPLGSAVKFREVHSALPDSLRKNICKKTVANRLAEKGYTSQEKLSADDGDRQWRENRLAFANFHRAKSELQWKNRAQAVGALMVNAHQIEISEKQKQSKTSVFYFPGLGQWTARENNSRRFKTCSASVTAGGGKGVAGAVGVAGV